MHLSAGRPYMSDELQALCFWPAKSNLSRRCAPGHQEPEKADREANLLDRLDIASALSPK